MKDSTDRIEVQTWAIDRLVPYVRNPRKNDGAVDRMCSSIREFGFKIPCLVCSNGEVIDGHLRLKAAQKLGIAEIPVILCDEWTDAQVKAFRLLVNRSVTWADWDDELLALEVQEINALDFDLSLTGFDVREIEDLLATPMPDEDLVMPEPAVATSHPGDLWILGGHRLLCGDATSAETVERLLGGRQPFVMVTDPPYGVELDSEWRDRAGLNGCGPAQSSYMKHRTKGHTETAISGDTRADWSEAFELVPSLQVGYVWHASVFTREVLNGLLRIGFTLHQQIIWNKGRAVLTRTPYWFAHEPCWFVRKKNAPWYGKAGENTTIWESSSPKFIMGGSQEDKFDHPTQKPLELMRRPIVNHTKRGEWIYDPFLGSGTTLMAAEGAGRLCCGLELDPKYVDVIIGRWQEATGKEAKLEGAGTTFEQVKMQRQRSSGTAAETTGASSAGSAPPKKKMGKKQERRAAGKKRALRSTGSSGRGATTGKVERDRFKKAA